MALSLLGEREKIDPLQEGPEGANEGKENSTEPKLSRGEVEYNGAAPSTVELECKPELERNGFPIDAKRFLDRIALDGRFAFQTFSDKKSNGKDPLAKQFFGSIAEYHAQLKSLNDRGAGIFVAPNEIQGNARNSKAVTKIRACWLDQDGSPLDLVLKGPLQPHIITNTSPGKYQSFWCISDLNLNAEIWKSIQQALTERFQGDSNVNDLPRVMRLPGYFHNKKDPHLVTIKEFNDSPDYTAAEMLKAFVDSDEEVNFESDAREELKKLTAELAAMEEETGRNSALNAGLYRMIEVFVNSGAISMAEVEQAFEDAAIACGCSGYKATIKSAKNAALKDVDSATPLTEQWLAQQLAQKHKDELRYIYKWNKWMWWNRKRWSEDEKRKAFSYAEKICRDTAKNPKAKTLRRTLQSARCRAAVVNLACSSQDLIAIVDQWDKDPWLLNTPGGVVDLKTGEMRANRREDYMTKMTAVAPDFEMATPIFNEYLERVQPDPEIRAYLQRRYGYALTGLTREETFDFDYGQGSNGKGTMYGMIAGIMGDYCATAPESIFILSRHEAHPTDAAHLAGARLAMATEIEEGRSWNEARIKKLTGGGKITVRRMHEDFWEYEPQFKLHITGNHQPNLKSVDEASKRRFVLVPWNIVIPEDERDLQLKEKLKQEWPGIFAWMIRGCLLWQEHGLLVPQKIREASSEYLKAQDPMPEFIDTYFVVEEGAKTKANAVYPAWKEFKESRSERPGRINEMTEKMERAGFPKEKFAEGFFYTGLRQSRFAGPEF